MKTKKHLVNISLFLLALLTIVVFKNCDCGGDPTKINVGVGGAKTSGSATITLNELNKAVTGADKKYITVAFSGALETPAEGTGETSFSTQKTIEVTASSVSPVPSVNRYNLKPGSWKMTVSTGTWSASCNKVIAADASASFLFKYNQDQCQ